MPNADVPAREQLVQRVSGLVPLLQKHGAWLEENRRLHDENDRGRAAELVDTKGAEHVPWTVEEPRCAGSPGKPSGRGKE